MVATKINLSYKVVQGGSFSTQFHKQNFQICNIHLRPIAKVHVNNSLKANKYAWALVHTGANHYTNMYQLSYFPISSSCKLTT